MLPSAHFCTGNDAKRTERVWPAAAASPKALPDRCWVFGSAYAGINGCAAGGICPPEMPAFHRAVSTIDVLPVGTAANCRLCDTMLFCAENYDFRDLIRKFIAVMCRL